MLPLLTLASAVSPVQSDGGGVRRDHLNDVCGTEEMQRSGFFGRQVAIKILQEGQAITDATFEKSRAYCAQKIHVVFQVCERLWTGQYMYPP